MNEIQKLFSLKRACLVLLLTLYWSKQIIMPWGRQLFLIQISNVLSYHICHHVASFYYNCSLSGDSESGYMSDHKLYFRFHNWLIHWMNRNTRFPTIVLTEFWITIGLLGLCLLFSENVHKKWKVINVNSFYLKSLYTLEMTWLVD